MHDVGKISCPQVQATLEADLIFPLLRGRNVARWHHEPAGHVLVVQDAQKKKGYPEKWLQEQYPLAWSYLKKFEGFLRERAAFKKFFDPDTDPFYSMYDIGTYTFDPVKIAWMDISSSVKATVISASAASDLVMPEHTVMFASVDSEDEAHYLAAVLNSEPVDTVISSYIVDNHLSTHPVDNVIIPKYDSREEAHVELANLSRTAHVAVSAEDSKTLSKTERAINRLAKKLW